MSGPVWRFEARTTAACDSCSREVTGVFVEGVITKGELVPTRLICPDCLRRFNSLVVAGELGRHTPSPAYAHRG